MEQRITRAKSRIAEADVPFETPGAVERAERLAAVAAMIYLVFNEGYSASGGDAPVRAPLCDEAIRLARLLLRLFQTEPEIMGLTALMLLQHARAPARFDADGAIVLLEDQDRGLWNRAMIAEGLALIDKAMRHRRPGPYQVQAAIAALHARAARPEDTDWARDRSALRDAGAAAALARGHAQPGGRRRQGARPGGGAGDDRAAGAALVGLFSLLRRQGRAPACSSAAPRRPALPSTGPSRSPTRRRSGPYPPAPRPAADGCRCRSWSPTSSRRRPSVTSFGRATRKSWMPPSPATPVG